jgi:5-methylcytosine-specific restriction enzyme subunit McrC
MQSISVFERETITVVRAGDARLHKPREADGRLCIDEASAAALERMNRTRPKFCRRVIGGIQLYQMCGIVRLPGGQVLEILPKIWSADETQNSERSKEEERARLALLRMLASNQDLKLSVLDNAAQDLAKLSLLDVFVRVFLKEVLRIAHGGLKSGYVETISDSPALRGRLMFVETQLSGVGRNGLVRCAHDDFSADNPYNQALLAALLMCRKFVLSAKTQRLWFEARSMLSAISVKSITVAAINRFARNRSTKRYDEALSWAKVILGLQSPTLSAGDSEAPSLLFDMEKLFERWVEIHTQKNLEEHLVARRHGTVKHLASISQPVGLLPASNARRPAFRLTPDVLVWRMGDQSAGSVLELVIDAKWKTIEPAVKDWGVREGDVYQMLAYATRFGCDQAALAYPVFRGLGKLPDPPIFHIDIGNGSAIKLNLRLIPIDA